MDLPLSKTPGLEAPPGEPSNFHIRNSLYETLIGTVTICLVLTAVFLMIRLTIRFKFDKSLKLEDCQQGPGHLSVNMLTRKADTSIACWVGFVTYNGIALAIGSAGAGRHQWDVSVESIIRIGLLGNVIEIVYGPTIWLAKLSVLLQYKHIFTPIKKQGVVYWSIHSLIWTNFLFYLIDTLVVIFECRPRAKIWNFMLPGSCLNATANFIVTGAWNVFSDVLILVLPIYAVWHLKIPLKKKLSVGALFATGLFACIASIVRLYYTVVWARTSDVTYVFMQVALWGLAELTTVVLCGSVIFLPKFIHMVQGQKHILSTSTTPPDSQKYRRIGSRPLVSNDTVPWADDERVPATDGHTFPLQNNTAKNKALPDPALADSLSIGRGIQKTTRIDVEGSLA